MAAKTNDGLITVDATTLFVFQDSRLWGPSTFGRPDAPTTVTIHGSLTADSIIVPTVSFVDLTVTNLLTTENLLVNSGATIEGATTIGNVLTPTTVTIHGSLTVDSISISTASFTDLTVTNLLTTQKLDVNGETTIAAGSSDFTVSAQNIDMTGTLEVSITSLSTSISTGAFEVTAAGAINASALGTLTLESTGAIAISSLAAGSLAAAGLTLAGGATLLLTGATTTITAATLLNVGCGALTAATGVTNLSGGILNATYGATVISTAAFALNSAAITLTTLAGPIILTSAGLPGVTDIQVNTTAEFNVNALSRITMTSAGILLESTSSNIDIFSDLALNLSAATNLGVIATNHIFSTAGPAEKFRVSSTGATVTGNLAVSGTISAPTRITTDNTTQNRKLVLFTSADNDHEFYGFGINSSTLRYQIDSITTAHRFYTATSPTTSRELFFINGNGQVGTNDLSRLRVAVGLNDFSVLGTHSTEDATNTRIAIFGAAASFEPGSIYYIATNVAAHVFLTSGVNEKFRVTPSGAIVTGDLTVTGTISAPITPASPLIISTSSAPGPILQLVRPLAGTLTLSVAAAASNFINQSLANDTCFDTDGTGNIRFSARSDSNQSLVISTSGEVSLCSTSGTAILTTTDPGAVVSGTLQVNTTPTYPITNASGPVGLRLNQNGAGIIEGNDSNFAIHFRKNRLGTIDDFNSHHAYSGHRFYGGNQVIQDQTVFLQVGPTNTSVTGNLAVSGAISAPTRITTDNTTQNRKLVLFTSADNDHEFFGFGINSSILRYQIGSTTAAHRFYTAASATTSRELFFINGNGQVGTNDLSRLRVAAGNTDFSVLGTHSTEDATNTRIAIFGSAASFEPGSIYYIATNTAAHVFFTAGANEKFRVTTSGATITGNLIVSGAISAPTRITTDNSTVNRKLVLFTSVDNDHEFFGFGINSSILRYQIGSTTAAHRFYTAASATTSQELFFINGNGQVGTNDLSRLRVAVGSTDFSVLGTHSTEDATNTRIAIFGSAASFEPGAIYYIATNTGAHVFLTAGANEKFRVTTTSAVVSATLQVNTTPTYPITDASGIVGLRLNQNGAGIIEGTDNNFAIHFRKNRLGTINDNINYHAYSGHQFYGGNQVIQSQQLLFAITPSGVNFSQPLFLSDNPLYLRSSPDTNHYINFNATRNGPGLYGQTGGSLGTTLGGVNEVAYWDQGALIMRKDFYTLNSGQSFTYSAGTFGPFVAADGGGASIVNTASQGKFTQVGSMVHVHFYCRFNVGSDLSVGIYYVELNGFPYTLDINGGANGVGASMGCCEIGGIEGGDLTLFGHLIANGATSNGKPGTGRRIFIARGSFGAGLTSQGPNWLTTPAPIQGPFFNDQILQGNFTMYI